MELLEQPITHSSEDGAGVYRDFSQPNYNYIYACDAWPSMTNWDLVLKGRHTYSRLAPQSTRSLARQKIQEYLNCFNNDASAVEGNITAWVTYFDQKFGSEAHVATTDDDELLIYWRRKGDLFNILIDEDSEVEIMYIPDDRRKSQNRLLQSVKETTTETIKKVFNEMQRSN